MICPVCKVPMMVVEYDGVELDHCVRCEGTWFDAGELSLLLAGRNADAAQFRPEALAALPEATTDEAPRSCPLCRRKLRKLLVGPAGDIMIDACADGDGLWFDRDEVARLAQQVADTASGPTGQALEYMGRVFHKRDPDEVSEEKTEGEDA